MRESRTIGRYEVLERLGAGASAEVYRARDTILDREVALKVLPDGVEDPGLHSALAREARLLAQLDHPNVERVHDLERVGGREVLVAELVPGRNLGALLDRGRLPLREVLTLGRQLAEGIGAAHAVGIVHCDLKPANIRVTSGGRLKIVDFGVARRLRAGAASGDADGPVAGSPAYMAPEQLEGRADARTDVYAAGVVLFELVTGRRPHTADGLTQLVDAVLHQPAPRAGGLARVPRALEQVLRRALERDPEARYPDGAALARALAKVAAGRRVRRRRLGLAGGVAALAAVWILGPQRPPPPAAPPEPVLEVSVRAEAPELADLAEGFEEALAEALGRAPGLRVRSVEEADPERRGPVHRLEGRLGRRGPSMRVRLAARDAEGGLRRRLERTVPPDGLLAVREELARGALAALGLGRLPKDPEPAPVGAVEGGAELLQVLGECRHALFAPKARCEDRYARLARAHPQLREAQVAWAWHAALAVHLQPEDERVDEARRRQVGRALEAAPGSPRAAQAAALVALCDWRWDDAVALTQAALRLGPGDAEVAFMASYVLTLAGRTDAGARAARRARDLAPGVALMHTNLGWAYLYARRFQDALEPLATAARLDPEDATPWRHLALVLLRLNRFEEAREAAAQVERVNAGDGPDGYTAATLAPIYAIAGEPGRARRSLDAYATREDAEVYVLALGYDALGDRERALDLLEAAVDARVSGVLFLKVDFLSDALRATPRFQALLERVWPRTFNGKATR